MNQDLHLPVDVKDVSDGYHTFAELYRHRDLLMAALMLTDPKSAYVARSNSDGEAFPGYVVAVLTLPTGQISYHVPEDFYAALTARGVPGLDWNTEYDGHSSDDVAQRLSNHLFVRPPTSPYEPSAVRMLKSIVLTPNMPKPYSTFEYDRTDDVATVRLSWPNVDLTWSNVSPQIVHVRPKNAASVAHHLADARRIVLEYM